VLKQAKIWVSAPLAEANRLAFVVRRKTGEGLQAWLCQDKSRPPLFYGVQLAAVRIDCSII